MSRISDDVQADMSKFHKNERNGRVSFHVICVRNADHVTASCTGAVSVEGSLRVPIVMKHEISWL